MLLCLDEIPVVQHERERDLRMDEHKTTEWMSIKQLTVARTMEY